MRGIVIAGTNSGCGKTTVTIGLMSLLAERIFDISPEKSFIKSSDFNKFSLNPNSLKKFLL